MYEIGCIVLFYTNGLIPIAINKGFATPYTVPVAKRLRVTNTSPKQHVHQMASKGSLRAGHDSRRRASIATRSSVDSCSKWIVLRSPAGARSGR